MTKYQEMFQGVKRCIETHCLLTGCWVNVVLGSKCRGWMTVPILEGFIKCHGKQEFKLKCTKDLRTMDSFTPCVHFH